MRLVLLIRKQKLVLLLFNFQLHILHSIAITNKFKLEVVEDLSY